MTETQRNIRTRLNEVARLARRMKAAIDAGDMPQNTDLLSLKLQVNAIINIANQEASR